MINLTLRASSYFFYRGRILGGGGLEAPPKISGLTKAMNLKFLPVLGSDNWKWYAKFQVGHLFGVYFTDQNVKSAKIGYWAIV